MIKMICDICGKTIKGNHDLNSIEAIKKVIVENDSFSTEYEKLDICNDCEYEFEKEKKLNEVKIIKKLKKQKKVK